MPGRRQPGPRAVADQRQRADHPGDARRPPRRRGGQELPDSAQDRPEQNAGYDEAVRSGPPGTPEDPLMELEPDVQVEELPVPGGETGAGDRPTGGGNAPLEEIDDRAERRARAEVRRRERRDR